VPVLQESVRDQIRRVEDLIKSEVNVKEVNYLNDASGVLNKKVKPNFKALGPKFGKDMKVVAEAITGMSASDLATIESTGSSKIQGFEIAISDIEILTEDMPGYLTASEGGLTIALDNTLTPELVREGNAREFVNRIQNLRKDSGFDVTDKINIQVQHSNDEWKASLDEFKAYISQEVQALSLEWVDSASTEITFEESNLFVNVTVA
jgi:isoleucyl-tRNA synthetase